MVDVARHAGVSIKTVSRVVNHEPNVQQQLIDRVLASVAELGFRRNHLARTLRSGQSTATIGLIIEEIANPFYATIAGVAAEVAGRARHPAHHRQLRGGPAARGAARPGPVLAPRRRPARSCRPGTTTRSCAPRSRWASRSSSSTGRPAACSPTPCCSTTAAARGRACQRLVESGHRRIGILLDSISVYTMRERLGGAQDALAAAGIGVRHEPGARRRTRSPTAAAAVAAMLLASRTRRPRSSA